MLSWTYFLDLTFENKLIFQFNRHSYSEKKVNTVHSFGHSVVEWLFFFVHHLKTDHCQMICVFLREREFGCVCLWEGGGCTWFLFKVNRTLRASRGSGVSHSKWGEPDSLLPFGGS